MFEVGDIVFIKPIFKGVSWYTDKPLVISAIIGRFQYRLKNLNDNVTLTTIFINHVEDNIEYYRKYKIEKIRKCHIKKVNI